MIPRVNLSFAEMWGVQRGDPTHVREVGSNGMCTGRIVNIATGQVLKRDRRKGWQPTGRAR
jgi:hypothetical protein